MERGDRGDAVTARPGDGAVVEKFRRGDVDDVGRERLQILARRLGQIAAQAIFGAAAGHRDCRDRHEVACRREGGRIDRRRIDADLHAAVEQVAHEQVQRLVGAVAGVIVIAAEERDTKVRRVHDGAGHSVAIAA